MKVLSAHGSASQHSASEPEALLIRKYHNLQRMAQLSAALNQCLADLQAGYAAQRPVIPSAVRHRVQMGACHDGRQCFILSLQSGNQVSGSIHLRFYSQLPEIVHEDLPSLPVLRRICHAGECSVFLGSALVQLFQPSENPV